jgi:hypothetical protein
LEAAVRRGGSFWNGLRGSCRFVYINYSPHSLQLGLACPQERIVCDWFDDALLNYALKSVVMEVEQREGVSLESVAALVGEQY